MFSFIVAVYKVEKYLFRCVDSLLAQTHKNFEIILVNDGSPDNCPQICADYVSKDDRVRVINKTNGGLVSARKAGVHVAEGEFICFIDGDDFIKVDFLETYQSILDRNTVDIICTGYTAYYENGDCLSNKNSINVGFFNKDALKKSVYNKMLSVEPFYTFFIFPSVWCKCFKKSLISAVYECVPDEISLGEDVAVTYPALLKANSIYVSDYTGYMYRQNPNSMTHSYEKNLYIKIRSLILHLKRVEEKEGWISNNQINQYIAFILIYAINNEFRYNKNDGFLTKKKNINLFLYDKFLVDSIKCVKVQKVKDKIKLFCLIHRESFLLYLLYRISR